MDGEKCHKNIFPFIVTECILQTITSFLLSTARLSAQKYFLGGGMVKNKPHSLKLILLLRSDIGLGKFTWTKKFLAPVAPVIEFSKTKSWLFVDFGHHGGNDQLKKEPLTSPTVFVQSKSSIIVENWPK